MAAPVRAQAPDRGRLLVTVADPSGAVIPAARVTVTMQEANASAPSLSPVLTTSIGVAAFEGLAIGRYTIQAEFPGFESVTVRDVRVRAGDNRRSIVLPIKKVAEDVTVGRDKQTAALDPVGAAFSTVLTREQIAALPDDPEEMERVLKAMAPPGATIRVDGFTGGRLPPKSQIRSIRLPRMDTFAAQNHGGMTGMLHIDITTQPGNGPLRGTVDMTFRDDALNARNPFTPEKGDEGLRQAGVTLSGTLVPNKSSFSFTGQRARQFDSASLLAAVPGTTVAESIRRPLDRLVMTGRFDQAVGKEHMFRASFSYNGATTENLGVGGYDLPERAYSTRTGDSVIRLSESGPLGRRFFSESRLQLRWSDSRSTALVEAPAIRVLDAFTEGGAQQAGGRDALEIEAASDLDYVRGPHSMRAGFLVERGRYRSDESTNYLGTYTFASLDDYQAGRASNYTRRLGDPAIRYANLQVGAYVQDDFRLARSLLLSYGLRYEVQTLVGDTANFSPRATLTWAPFRSGRTTFRAGAGMFTDWLPVGVYEQTLRVDGVRQREINVIAPSFPDPGPIGQMWPTNKYLLAEGMRLPEAVGINAGVDQLLTPSLRLGAVYMLRRGRAQLRGRNLNALVDGARPDPRYVNVIRSTGDAEARIQMFHLGATMMMLERRQTFFAIMYTFSSMESNTAGPFAPPPHGDDIGGEWAVAAPKHRFGGTFNTQPVRDLGVSLNVRAQSGTPYTVTTGFDDNSDGIFNDRPPGAPRGSMLTPWQWDVGMRISYAIGFGRRPSATGSGGQTVIMIGGPGGGIPPGGFSGGAAGKRYRIELYASAQNVTNRANYIGYSGVLSSPFFGKPTNVLNPRKIELGARFGF